MKFLDALMSKPPAAKAQISPAEVGQPTPIAFLREPPSDLTSGSDINEAAVGAWPVLIDGGFKYRNGGWRKSVLREVSNQNTPSNYGSETSKANFGFRFREFLGIGGMPGPIPNPYRPTFNNLIAISWGLRVANPNTKTNTTAQKGPITIQTKPSSWQSSSTASLTKTGETLL
ncbi:MAG TPA: hypothetical protein VGF75_06290 [Candidatus Saccharimonadales bacterium]|jgi:hypothetical protein